MWLNHAKWANGTYYISFTNQHITNNKKKYLNIHLLYYLSYIDCILVTSVCKFFCYKICINFSIFHSFNGEWVVYLLILFFFFFCVEKMLNSIQILSQLTNWCGNDVIFQQKNQWVLMVISFCYYWKTKEKLIDVEEYCIIIIIDD